MTMGGSLGKGGNPFGGGSQLGAWGEKGRLIDKFAVTVNQLLPQIAEPVKSIPANDADIAEQIERLVKLRDTGALSDDEFSTAKTRLLGG